MPSMMRAIVLTVPGGPEALEIRNLPRPAPRDGCVLIRVEAFGLNRSELHTRLGLSPSVTLPRVLGIECVGVVEAAPGTDLVPGQKVAAMMGDMGRQYDGGYAEFTSIPRAHVFPLQTELPWETLGALPEMYQTSLGALTKGLDVRAGDTLLIRGGTSSIGMATAAIAKQLGLTVISTTRNAGREAALRDNGADHVVVDTGVIADAVRKIVPAGVDRALELVGTPTLRDTLRATRVHGVVCMAGMLSNQWTVPDFYPIEYIPSGVFLTGYGGDSDDITTAQLQSFVDAVASGTIKIATDRVFAFDDIVAAHRYMEDNRATGKLVVRVAHPRDSR
jgi:NADPH:quinone reductase-like Zn-dependent oxidoreductase